MDTTVFCNVLNVPGLNQDSEEVFSELETNISNGDTLLLPMAAVIETGNHIAQLSGGSSRRKSAEKFCGQVMAAIDGTAPWTAMKFWESEQLRGWLGEFPDRAMQEVGMGDLSIIKDWERMCELQPGRRVRIWSLDSHLQGYDRDALI